MDVFDYMSVLAPFGLMLLGAFVSLREDWAKSHHKSVLAAFIAMGMVGVIASAKSASDNAGAKVKLDKLGKATDEIKRLTDLNTQLQEKLVELSKQSIETVTGGDSYSYLRFPTFDQTGGFPIILHEGKFPLYDLEVQIVDLNRFEQSTAKLKQPSLQQYFLSSTAAVLKVGTLAPNQGHAILGKPVPFTNEQPKFRIFFKARNGFWDQDLLLRKVKGEWLHAMRVHRELWGQENNPRQLLFTKIDDGFPTGANGKIEWPK
jgi:hypothetical protein